MTGPEYFFFGGFGPSYATGVETYIPAVLRSLPDEVPIDVPTTIGPAFLGARGGVGRRDKK